MMMLTSHLVSKMEEKAAAEKTRMEEEEKVFSSAGDLDEEAEATMEEEAEASMEEEVEASMEEEASGK